METFHRKEKLSRELDCNKRRDVNDQPMSETVNTLEIAENASRHPASPEFLKLFYPFHYVVGEAMEKSLQGPTLSHHEAVILWMIHSEGPDRKSLPRKEIERLICSWYELGSPAVTKVLKRMATREKPLITILSSADSGREKTVFLTDEGEREVALMMERATHTIDQIIEGWGEKEIKAGLRFLAKVVERVEQFDSGAAV